MIINKAIGHKAKYNHNIIDAVYKIFHMGYYLVLYRNTDSANVSVVDIKKLLSVGGFRLTKWISVHSQK